MSRSPYQLVCFDVDGTLVGRTVFVWETLHERFGTNPVRRKQAWNDYFSGRIRYTEWFELDIELFRETGPVTKQRLLDALSALELAPGAHETLAALQEAGLRLAVVSGSLDIVLEKFGLRHYFDDVFVNELYFNRLGALLACRATPFDIEAKAGALEWLCGKYGFELSKTAFVGDNFNDLSIARRAGCAIAFNSSCADLIACSKANVAGDNLRAILPHLLTP